MIPATVPCYAAYTCKLRADDDRTYREYRPVLAWNDDGCALVAADKSATLAPADHYRNFAGLTGQADYQRNVALIPAGGWRIEVTPEDGQSWSEPLVGWALREDGAVVPLITDANGSVDDVEGLGEEWRIYHDDQRPTPTN